MTLFGISLPWRKQLLIIAGALSFIYAIIVLWYVHSMPDIGLRSAFDNSVKRFDGELLQMPTGGSNFSPQEEDRILKLGGLPVLTWSNLLQALDAFLVCTLASAASTL